MRKFCCDEMERKINQKCEFNKSVFECPDNLIWFDSKFNEYGLIIHDGGESYVEINYCPWCGCKLPKSKRELWFNTLEKLGYNDPVEQDIPEDFKSDKWYSREVNIMPKP